MTKISADKSHLVVNEQIKERYKLPYDAIFDGSCNIISNDSESIEILKIAHAISKLEIHGLGDVAYKIIAQNIDEPFEIFTVCENNESDLIQELGESRYKILVDGLAKIQVDGFPIETVLDFLMISGMGTTIREQIGNYYSKIPYDFSGLIKDVVAEATSSKTEEFIISIIKRLKQNLGIDIIYNQVKSVGKLKYILTGKPNDFGYSKKSEFVDQKLVGYTEVKNMSDADILVTDDLNSKTSKMKQAEKFGVKVVTYGDQMFA